MTQKQKVAICGAIAGVLSFLGLFGTPLCSLLPVGYQQACFLAGKLAPEAAKAIASTMPDGGN